MKGTREVTGARCHERALRELRKATLAKHGKLRGFLMKEVDLAIERRTKEILEEGKRDG